MKTREIDAKQIKTIKWPSALRSGKVFIVENKDSITFSKMKIPTATEIRQKLKILKGRYNEKEIIQEIQDYRQGK